MEGKPSLSALPSILLSSLHALVYDVDAMVVQAFVSCVAIAGADYCVIAADTRMSAGYNILTRQYSKITKLADKCVMASSGFQADVKALQKLLAARHLVRYISINTTSRRAVLQWVNYFPIPSTTSASSHSIHLMF